MNWRVIRLVAAGICIAIAGLLVIGAGLPDRVQVHEGASAPLFQTRTISNQPLSLAALRGHPVIINFWATWCGPCVIETPLLQSAYATHTSDGLQIIGVDSGEAVPDIAVWKSRFGVTYDLVVDSAGQISSLYSVAGLPTTFFIARDGTVRRVITGMVNANQLQAELARMLH